MDIKQYNPLYIDSFTSAYKQDAGTIGNIRLEAKPAIDHTECLLVEE